MKKNAKQILVLERERVSGGDGFLSAAQTSAKARGETIEVGTKKKKANPVGVKKGNLANLMRGRKSGASTPTIVEEEGGGGVSRASTAEPGEEGEEEGVVEVFRNDIITCQCSYGLVWARVADLGARSYACCAAVVIAGEEVL